MVIQGARSGAILQTSIKTINVPTETHRYTNIGIGTTWDTADSYDMEPPYENYIGHKDSLEYDVLETNSLYIPISGFSFLGESVKLVVSGNMFCVSPNFQEKGFNWAICTSIANRSLYEGQTPVTNDPYQLASGWSTMPYVEGYQVNSLEFPAYNIPPNTPIYLFWWPNGTFTDVSHIQGNLKVSLYYES